MLPTPPSAPAAAFLQSSVAVPDAAASVAPPSVPKGGLRQPSAAVPDAPPPPSAALQALVTPTPALGRSSSVVAHGRDRFIFIKGEGETAASVADAKAEAAYAAGEAAAAAAGGGAAKRSSPDSAGGSETKKPKRSNNLKLIDARLAEKTKCREYTVYPNLDDVPTGQLKFGGVWAAVTKNGKYARFREDRYATKEKPKPTVGDEVIRLDGKNIEPFLEGVPEARENLIANEKNIYRMFFLREGATKKEKAIMETSTPKDAVAYANEVVLPRLLREELLSKVKRYASFTPAFYVWTGRELNCVYILGRHELTYDEEALARRKRLSGFSSPKAIKVKDVDVLKAALNIYTLPEEYFQEKNGECWLKSSYHEIRNVPMDMDGGLADELFLSFDAITDKLIKFMKHCQNTGNELSRWGQHLVFYPKVLELLQPETWVFFDDSKENLRLAQDYVEEYLPIITLPAKHCVCVHVPTAGKIPVAEGGDVIKKYLTHKEAADLQAAGDAKVNVTGLASQQEKFYKILRILRKFGGTKFKFFFDCDCCWFADSTPKELEIAVKELLERLAAQGIPKGGPVWNTHRDFMIRCIDSVLQSGADFTFYTDNNPTTTFRRLFKVWELPQELLEQCGLICGTQTRDYKVKCSSGEMITVRLADDLSCTSEPKHELLHYGDSPTIKELGLFEDDLGRD